MEPKRAPDGRLASSVVAYPPEALSSGEIPFVLDSSLSSYPVRGPYGQWNYPGNVSGYLVRDIIKTLGSVFVVDPAEGSGTSRDVCKDINVLYSGFDLKDGFDLTSMSLRAAIKNSLPETRKSELPDLIFFHAPYWNMIPYSGKAWGKSVDPADMSWNKSVEEFFNNILTAMYNIYDATRPGGYFVLLIGDRRLDGHFFSLQSRVMEAFRRFTYCHVIKLQHNCTSNKKAYPKTFIPLAHEHLLFFQKPLVNPPKATEIILDEAARASQTIRQAKKSLVDFALLAEKGEPEDLTPRQIQGLARKLMARIEDVSTDFVAAMLDAMTTLRKPL